MSKDDFTSNPDARNFTDDGMNAAIVHATTQQGVFRLSCPFDEVRIVVGSNSTVVHFHHKGKLMAADYITRPLNAGDVLHMGNLEGTIRGRIHGTD